MKYVESLVIKLWTWLRGKNIQDQKAWEDLYQGRIKFLKDELEQSRANTAGHKIKHPGNGKEVDEWRKEVDELYVRLFNCLQENRELHGKIIFYDELVKRLEAKVKKGRGMYE